MALNFDFKSMDKKKLGIIVVAVVAGLIAVVLTNSYIEQTSQEKAKKMAGGLTSEETQQLMQRIQVLEQANQELANQQNMLAQAQQQQAAEAQNQQQQAPVRVQQSLAIKTPIGKRAYTVMIEKLSAVGGMISPGDYVDIIVHLNIPAELRASGQPDATTVTLFQDVLILAVADSMQAGVAPSPEAQAAASIPITFALDPREAGLLSFAQKNGTLQLQLRPPLDKDAYLLPVSTWNTLSQFIASTQGGDLGVKPPQQATVGQEPVVEQKPKIEIFRGGQ